MGCLDQKVQFNGKISTSIVGESYKPVYLSKKALKVIFIIFHLFSYWIELTLLSFLVSFFISTTYEKICQCNSFLFDDNWKTPISGHFPKVTFDNIFGAFSVVFSSQEWRETTVKTSFIIKPLLESQESKDPWNEKWLCQLYTAIGFLSLKWPLLNDLISSAGSSVICKSWIQIISFLK